MKNKVLESLNKIYQIIVSNGDQMCVIMITFFDVLVVGALCNTNTNCSGTFIKFI